MRFFNYSSTLACFLALSSVSYVNAAEPTSLAADARIVRFNYDENTIYQILSRPLTLTHIRLPPGETVTFLGAGDTSNFVIYATASKTDVFVKPKIPNHITSLTIKTTSDKVFQFSVKSGEDRGKYYQEVNWDMPAPPIIDETANTLPAKGSFVADKDNSHLFNPKTDNSNYTITGNAHFRPTFVYDNGVMIRMVMPKSLVEMPVVFARKNGKLGIVNYITDGNFILIQQMADEVVLKLDKEEVSIKPNARVAMN